jgi:uncharacterized membrane protein
LNNEAEREKVYKVRKVWLVMECERGKEPVKKVTVSALHRGKNKSLICKKALKTVKNVSFTALKLMAGTAAGFLTAAWIIPAVNESRGYKAVGGEWLIIYITIFAGIYFTDKALRRIGRR